MASSRSYAEALRNRSTPNNEYHFPGTLPPDSNSDRRSSAISNISPKRSTSITSIPEVIPESSELPAGTLFPPSSSQNTAEQSRPSLKPRRPSSIAQVLSGWSGAISRPASYYSDAASRLSYVGEGSSSRYDEPAVPVRGSKKKKKNKARKKNSQTRDHGE